MEEANSSSDIESSNQSNHFGEPEEQRQAIMNDRPIRNPIAHDQDQNDLIGPAAGDQEIDQRDE